MNFRPNTGKPTISGLGFYASLSCQQGQANVRRREKKLFVAFLNSLLCYRYHGATRGGSGSTVQAIRSHSRWNISSLTAL
jgi:hypothetical protein